MRKRVCLTLFFIKFSFKRMGKIFRFVQYYLYVSVKTGEGGENDA